MTNYDALDIGLGFFGFVFTTFGFVALIFHWKALFKEVRDSCKNRIAHPKRGRLLWLVSLTIATWLLAAVIYSHDISFAWNMMKDLQREDQGGEPAYASTLAYFIVLVILGGEAFIFTSWFLYHHRRELPNLVMIIRFNAGTYHSVVELESQRITRREPHTANTTEANRSPSNSEATPTEGQVNLNQRPGFVSYGDALHLTPSSSASDAQVNTRLTLPPTFDRWFTTPDTDSCSSCASEYMRTIPCVRPAKHREPLTPTSPTEALPPFASDVDADAENTDAHSGRRLDPKRKRGNGRYVRKWLETEIPRLCQGHECRCAQVGAHPQHRNSSEGIIEGLEDIGARPKCIRASREILSELMEGRSSASETTRRMWEDAPGYVAGVEDNDDGEESDVSDDAVARRPEGADSEAWNNEDSSISYGSAPEQGFQIERKDTGPLNNAREPNNQTTSAQEQRPRRTGTAFFPPALPARRPRGANILADERDRGRRPSLVENPRDVTRPLRLTIPTQRFRYAEPPAPTTPMNMHSLAEAPGSAYARDGWRNE